MRLQNLYVYLNKGRRIDNSHVFRPQTSSDIFWWWKSVFFCPKLQHSSHLSTLGVITAAAGTPLRQHFV
jgi:hypothetical protein